MERVAAKSGGDSTMPVGYALGAARALLGRLTDPVQRHRLALVLNDVSNYIQADPGRRDPGRRLEQLIEAMRQALQGGL
jgi:hypothetical protein